MEMISIGRDSSNRIVIPDNSSKISRNHGTLRIFDNGTMSYSDHSTNGTWVNGNLIRNSEVPVQRGSNIMFPNNVQLNWSQVPLQSSGMSNHSQAYGNRGTGASKVDMFIISNAKYFESHQISLIRDRLAMIDDSKWVMVQSVKLKNPTTILIISLFFGHLGIDRFMIGDTGLGIGKLLTLGGLGFWAIIDWFLIQKATRERNMEKLQSFLY